MKCCEGFWQICLAIRFARAACCCAIVTVEPQETATWLWLTNQTSRHKYIGTSGYFGAASTAAQQQYREDTDISVLLLSRRVVLVTRTYS